MESILVLLIILVTFLFILVLLIFIYLILNNRKNNYLKEQLLIISNKLNEAKDNTKDRLYKIEECLNNNYVKSNELNNQTFNNLNEKLIKIDSNQKIFEKLSDNIISLKDIMVDKKTRGLFGEIELYSLLERAFGDDLHFYARQAKLDNNTRVDALIYGFGALKDICIDSKFPLENYHKMYDENLAPSEKEKARSQFKNDIYKHLNDIKNKYIIPNVTAPLAFMFVPSEAIFSEIYGKFPEIIDKAYELKVYIVSPTTLMAYITAIKSIYLDIKKDEKAKEMEKILIALSYEFTRLKDRCENLQKDFEKIIPDFEKMFISQNKIIKRFNALEKGDIEDA